MNNETIIDLAGHQQFYDYILLKRLSNRFFKNIFIFLITLNLIALAMTIIAISQYGLNFSLLQGYRDLLRLIFIPVALILLLVTIFFKRYRKRVYPYVLPATLFVLFLTTIGTEQFQYISLAFIFFIIIIFRSNKISGKIALRNFEKRGVATYNYFFNEQGFSLQVIDFSKRLNEDGEVVVDQNIKDSHYQYSDILSCDKYQDTLYLKLAEDTYLIIALNKFAQSEALEQLQIWGLKINEENIY